MKPEELVAEGLYDPDAPGAQERLALLEFALDQGLTLDEIRHADAANHLHVAVAEVELRPSRQRFTLAEAAARAGVDESFAREVWRVLGFADPAPDDPVCGAEDAAILAALHASPLWSEHDQLRQRLLRTIGESARRIAEAIVTTARTGLEAPVLEHGGDQLEFARVLTEAARVSRPELERLIVTTVLHHVEAVGRRYTLSGDHPSAGTADLVVGFADVVGYTPLSGSIAPPVLAEVVDQIEADTTDAIVAAGAEVVKRIGDEVMFVTPSSVVAAQVAGALSRRIGAGPLELRIGMARGPVLPLGGDFYGRTVNLASRLTRAAEPGQALVSEEVAAELPAPQCEELGILRLDGFDEQVRAFVLHHP